MKITFRNIVYALFVAVLLPAAIWIYYPMFLPRPPIAYEKTFAKIYEEGLYSSSDHPQEYLALVQEYLLDPKIQTVVALGCADWQAIHNMVMPEGKTYIGYDVVPEVIFMNNAEFSSDKVHFYYVEDLKDFVSHKVSGDLLIVKDFLQYWPNSAIKYFIAKILPRFRYAIITNTYTQNPSKINADIFVGQSHALDLLKDPFHLHKARVVLEYNSLQSGHKQTLLHKS